MSDTFVVEAELRSDEGKGASRRLRRLEAKVRAPPSFMEAIVRPSAFR